MSTAAESLKAISLQPGIIYGPLRSRRLGLSLGINLLPEDYKLCSFNCVYCQYGWTTEPVNEATQALRDLPRPLEVAGALEKALKAIVRKRQKLDAITFSGNGEPTLHPDFPLIVETARSLRDKYLPQVKLAVLSNSATVTRPEIRAALDRLDLRIMKLDAGSEEIVHQLNGPAPPFYLREIVTGLKDLNDVILQSLFVQGRITNADPDSVALWIENVREIHPSVVQVYTLDRAPADSRIWKVNRPTLEWIAGQVRWRAGVKAEIY
ncbi:MAG TPA: radical SAM protein [Candidatus Binatia bacterium]|jgi:wyosine [tRNA(Phe)-imidazoG37] synthetase (radical SAM superfamily)